MDLFDQILGRNPFSVQDPRHSLWNGIVHNAELAHAQAMAATEGLDPDSLEMWLAVFAPKFDLGARVALGLMMIPGCEEQTFSAYKTRLSKLDGTITTW